MQIKLTEFAEALSFAWESNETNGWTSDFHLSGLEEWGTEVFL